MQQMQETLVQSLGWEDSLEKELATHSSILAQRVQHNWAHTHPWTATPSPQNIIESCGRFQWDNRGSRALKAKSLSKWKSLLLSLLLISCALQTWNWQRKCNNTCQRNFGCVPPFSNLESWEREVTREVFLVALPQSYTGVIIGSGGPHSTLWELLCQMGKQNRIWMAPWLTQCRKFLGKLLSPADCAVYTDGLQEPLLHLPSRQTQG